MIFPDSFKPHLHYAYANDNFFFNLQDFPLWITAKSPPMSRKLKAVPWKNDVKIEKTMQKMQTTKCHVSLSQNCPKSQQSSLNLYESILSLLYIYL